MATAPVATKTSAAAVSFHVKPAPVLFPGPPALQPASTAAGAPAPTPAAQAAALLSTASIAAVSTTSLPAEPKSAIAAAPTAATVKEIQASIEELGERLAPHERNAFVLSTKELLELEKVLQSAFAEWGLATKTFEKERVVTESKLDGACHELNGLKQQLAELTDPALPDEFLDLQCQMEIIKESARIALELRFHLDHVSHLDELRLMPLDPLKQRQLRQLQDLCFGVEKDIADLSAIVRETERRNEKPKPNAATLHRTVTYLGHIVSRHVCLTATH